MSRSVRATPSYPVRCRSRSTQIHTLHHDFRVGTGAVLALGRIAHRVWTAVSHVCLYGQCRTGSPAWAPDFRCAHVWSSLRAAFFRAGNASPGVHARQARTADATPACVLQPCPRDTRTARAPLVLAPCLTVLVPVQTPSPPASPSCETRLRFTTQSSDPCPMCAPHAPVPVRRLPPPLGSLQTCSRGSGRYVSVYTLLWFPLAYMRSPRAKPLLPLASIAR